ncbi:MAG: trigger factor [Lachnospiraceae bacterium]|nr:trigger factor [Lachnospiraceae bacterium]
MNTSIEKLEKNMAKITVEVPTEEFEKAVEKAFQKNKNKISIPGFRKGKVSRQVMEKMYGKDVFYADAANICIPEAWENAYNDSEEEIVSSPDIDVVQMESGKPFIFTATVALNPVAEIGEYRGIHIEKISAEVTDEDVEERINKEREEQSRMVAVDREVKDGDQAIIDFEGFLDGVAFEGGKAENHPLTIGSGAFIPGFEEQIIGHKAGDEFDVNVKFPEDYQADHLKGKPAVFKCKLHEVKEKEVPELDADFADDAGFDSVDEYKADIRKKLEEKKVSEAKDKKESAVIEKLVEGMTVEVPEAMIETDARRSIDEFSQRLMMQGMSIQQYYQYTGLNQDIMLEQTRPQAEKRIRSRLALEAVANAENIEVSEEDLTKELEEMAENYNMKVDEVRNMLSKREIEAFRKDIRIKKALEIVVDNAVED